MNFHIFDAEVYMLGIIATLRIQTYLFERVLAIVYLCAGVFVQACIHELEFRILDL